MNKYYQNELDNLRELAVEFSKAYPTLAPQLAAQSADPDVERILEGVAFLTSKIHQKIDDDFPEFSQGLLKQVFPHYLRPLPSATIIEFKPKAILKNQLTVPSRTYIDSVEVEGVNCRFSTTYDIDVLPLTIKTVQLGETITGKKTIELNFDLNGQSLNSVDLDNLPVHLSGDFHTAADLYYLLSTKLESIEVSSSAAAEPVNASGVKLEPMGFEPENALLDYPSNAFPAYRLIQEYFLMKEKFLFIKIKGLNKYLQRIGGSSFMLKFYLDESVSQLPRVNRNCFVLHASPAVNLFKHDAESIVNDHKRSEYRVRPLRESKGQYHIHSIDKVLGHNRENATKNEYREIGLSDPDKNTFPVYQINYRQTDTGDKTDAFLSFSYPREYDYNSQETLLMELTCSNGNLPSKLKPGNISKPTASTSEMVEFQNILQPSENQAMPTDSSMLWRLLSHLSLNYLSLADTENFKALLSLYIFSNATGNKQEVANRKRIDGVTDISVEPCDRLIRGVPMRGQAIRTKVNPDNFACKGDMYLFGMLLDYLFGSFASLNCFTEFTMIDELTDETYVWPLRLGERPLI